MEVPAVGNDQRAVGHQHESRQRSPYVTALSPYQGAGANSGVEGTRSRYGTRSVGTQSRTKEYRDMVELVAVYISEDEGGEEL